MGRLKSYNVFNSFIEHRKIFAIFSILDVLLLFYFKNITDPVGFATVGSMLIVISYFLVHEYKNLNIVLEYMKLHEIEMYKKYVGDARYGIRVYFRDFTQAEIEKLLESQVGACFAECYKLPIRIATTAVYFVLLAIVLNWLHSNSNIL